MSVPDHEINPPDDRPCFWCWLEEHRCGRCDGAYVEPDDGYGKACSKHAKEGMQDEWEPDV